MQNVVDLWGSLDLTRTLPEPVEILQQQGTALFAKTNGKLYGEVIDSGVPTIDGLEFNFYVGVSDKPYRTLLFSIRCDSRAGYPVSISNTYAGSLEQVHDRISFENKIRLILSSPVTLDLLQNLLSVVPA